MLGPHTTCPNTKLPYKHCCGAKKETAEAAGAGKALTTRATA